MRFNLFDCGWRESEEREQGDDPAERASALTRSFGSQRAHSTQYMTTVRVKAQRFRAWMVQECPIHRRQLSPVVIRSVKYSSAEVERMTLRSK
jgi:hypothetical protein